MKARMNAARFAAFFLVFAPILASQRCDGSDSTRQGKREIFGKVGFLGGEEERDGPWQEVDPGVDPLLVNPGTVLQEDDWLLYGGGIGWNLTDHWNMNMELLYAATDITLEMPYGLDPGEGTRQTFTFLLNAEYNFFAKPLTPFVSGGFGLVYWQDDLTWDIYGGPVEISSNDLDNAEDLDIAWALGAGARWDVTDWLFIKVSYEILGIPGGDHRDVVSLSSGLMFR